MLVGKEENWIHSQKESKLTKRRNFKIVEHSQFNKMIECLRPRYQLPIRFQIGAELLDEVYSSFKTEIENDLAGKVVCMSLDGWNNVRDDSIECISVTDKKFI